MKKLFQQQPITATTQVSVAVVLEYAAEAVLAEAVSLFRLSRQRKVYALRVGVVLAKFFHAEFQPHFKFSRLSLLDLTEQPL